MGSLITQIGKKYENLKAELDFYLMSLWILFALVIILTINIPVSFSKDSKFIGWVQLLKLNIIPLIAFLLLIYGILLSCLYKYKLNGTKQLPVKITEIKSRNYDYLTFLTTYIIPLICIDITRVRYLIVFALLLIIIGIIFIKTGVYFANPTLALLGFHLYQINTEKPGFEDIIIISREKLKVGDNVQWLPLDEKIRYVGKCHN